MARAIITSSPSRRRAYEPLYDIDPPTGATIELFYGDVVLDGPRWFWWSCRRGRLPDKPPDGPFAYRDATGGGTRVFGRCANLSSAAQTTDA
jgi:hypothetical protein